MYGTSIDAARQAQLLWKPFQLSHRFVPVLKGQQRKARNKNIVASRKALSKHPWFCSQETFWTLKVLLRAFLLIQTANLLAFRNTTVEINFLLPSLTIVPKTALILQSLQSYRARENTFICKELHFEDIFRCKITKTFCDLPRSQFLHRQPNFHVISGTETIPNGR